MASRRGRSGDDILYGSAQRDHLSGLNGDDRMYGRDGDDRMAGGAGNDYLSGGKGTDILLGDTGDDRLYGDQGKDSLYGGANRDALFGGPGADRLDGGAGRDALHGGDGADRLVYDAQDRLIDGDAGRDTLIIGGSGVTLDLNLAGTPRIDHIEVIDLNGAGANTLRLDAADVLAINTQHTLLVMGGADDSVISPTDVWTQNVAGAVDIGGQHYLAWDVGLAHLLVDADITLNNVTPGGESFASFQNVFFSSFTDVSLVHRGTIGPLTEFPIVEPPPV